MAKRQRRKLEVEGGLPVSPNPVPTDLDELLDLMDDASERAEGADGSGAPMFDHAMRIFNQLHAHHQTHVARELGAAHQGLKTATNALKVATWWLAGVTVLLGLVEIGKLLVHE